MASARAIFSFRIRKYRNLLITWVGFLVAQKQGGALGLCGNLCT